jgi:hypothetical protein
MEQAMTTTTATPVRNTIKVKAAPKGCTATVYQFSVGKPDGRGAKFLRDRYAVAKAIDANHAVLTDGGMVIGTETGNAIGSELGNAPVAR